MTSLFSQFEPALLEEIIANGVIKTIPAGEILMRTGQFIKMFIGNGALSKTELESGLPIF